MTSKYICIHAHFYQPPRDNPWLEHVEREISSAPYQNWNERITAECYGPNIASPILEKGKTIRVINNYENISFNFGPTLLSWMEKNEPEIYRRIIESDRASAKERGGHGNAIAQVYNHSIMPLNGARDKETQIIWGITDFERRFGRKPEGIWLAETAVDSETLKLAAKHGIKFTVLAPHQALKVRPFDIDVEDKGEDAEWTDVNNGIDTTVPYLFRTGGADDIAVFFYDGNISHSIAFGGALNDGTKLAEMLKDALDGDENENGKGNAAPRLSHIATDGESYGHHHRFGDMALAVVIDTLQKDDEINLVNYGQYLEAHPPETEVMVREESSWSCAHGVERWRSDCGCHTGGEPGWSQKWRAPLRDALNVLKERLDALFEEEAAKYFASPWDARNDYINVILNREEETINRFFEKHSKSAGARLDAGDATKALKLFEMQRMAMTMFTSCGWFFNDVSGLETVQILKYAARAASLAREFSKDDLENDFLKNLSAAGSNVKKHGNGAEIYRKHITPLKLDPKRAVAHHVIVNSLREKPVDSEKFYSFSVEVLDNAREERSDQLIMVGRLRLTSSITLEKWDMAYCLVHFGSYDFKCAVKPYANGTEGEEYSAAKKEMLEAFRSESAPDIIHAVEKRFGAEYFSLKAVFDAERVGVMRELMERRIREFEDAYISVFEKNMNLLDLFIDVNVDIPYEIKISAKYALEKQLAGLFNSGDYSDDIEAMEKIFGRADKWEIELYLTTLRKNIFRFLERRMKRLCDDDGCERVKIIVEVMGAVRRRELDIDLWRLQSILYPYLIAAKDPADPLHETVKKTGDFEVLFRIFNFKV
ncbi:MAG: DUF3536 domain-containing protein [Nitrospinota bacterium]